MINRNRQGDILIELVTSLPNGLKEIINKVIVEGKSSGHKHRLIKGKVYKSKGGTIYLKAETGDSIVHEEHPLIKLKKGFYKITRQREYSNKDAVRLVVD